MSERVEAPQDDARRVSAAAWAGTWAMIAIAHWLPFVWRRIMGGPRSRAVWGELDGTLDPQLQAVLDATRVDLRVLGFAAAIMAVALADRLRPLRPRWLAWTTFLAAVAAAVSYLLNVSSVLFA